jgi:hypothetical protein
MTVLAMVASWLSVFFLVVGIGFPWVNRAPDLRCYPPKD